MGRVMKKHLLFYRVQNQEPRELSQKKISLDTTKSSRKESDESPNLHEDITSLQRRELGSFLFEFGLIKKSIPLIEFSEKSFTSFLSQYLFFHEEGFDKKNNFEDSTRILCRVDNLSLLSCQLLEEGEVPIFWGSFRECVSILKTSKEKNVLQLAVQYLSSSDDDMITAIECDDSVLEIIREKLLSDKEE